MVCTRASPRTVSSTDPSFPSSSACTVATGMTPACSLRNSPDACHGPVSDGPVVMVLSSTATAPSSVLAGNRVLPQLLETGTVTRSDASLDGRRLPQRPAQPPEPSELEAVGLGRR